MSGPFPHRCATCDAPAVVRYAHGAPGERAEAALERRAQYRCAGCWRGGEVAWIAGYGARVLVLDPMFSLDATAGALCDCGLPADHRAPASGEGRPCRPALDETVRMIPARPPVR